eukprot:7737919-Pyramimonas_sp.AAC.1
MPVKDLRLIGETCRATFAPSSDVNKVRAFGMSKKVTLHFEIPTAAGIFRGNFLAKNTTWDYLDPMNPSTNLSLRLRRDMNLNSRQLFCPPAKFTWSVTKDS